jgi:hypothetical protein
MNTRLRVQFLPYAIMSTAMACWAPSMAAQAIEGVVRHPDGRQVAGVLVELTDASAAVVARTLSDDGGRYLLRAPHPGEYALRARRLGFAPSEVATVQLGPSSKVIRAIELHALHAVLDTMRTSAPRSCNRTNDSPGQLFLWEQTRAALQAAQFSQQAPALSARILEYERELSARGTVQRHTDRVFTQAIREPWRAAEPSVLHDEGYVQHAADGGTIYRLPGLNMLSSDVFASDHCLAFSRDGDLLIVAFDPVPSRRAVAEISGLITANMKRAELISVEYRYVNLPNELDAPAGGVMRFAYLADGRTIISRWSVRMPVFERRVRSVRFGGSDVRHVGYAEQGGELVLAALGKDTLWAQPPREYRGTVIDSATGTGVNGARLRVQGTAAVAGTDAAGEFRLSELLPGEYLIDVNTASLDSLHRTHTVTVVLKNDSLVHIRVPDAMSALSKMCMSGSGRVATLVGQVSTEDGERLPSDTRVSATWTEKVLRGTALGGRVEFVPREREAPTRNGSFHFCGMPTETNVHLAVVSDSGTATPVVTRISTSLYAHASMSFERHNALVTIEGIVSGDSLATPLGGVEVELVGSERRVISGLDGRFIMPQVPRGNHLLRLRRLGYVATDTVIAISRAATNIRLRMERIAILESVATLASPLPQHFDEHRKLGLGVFLSREQLRKQEGRRLSDILGSLRGLSMSTGPGGRSWVFGGRSTTTAGRYRPSPDERLQGIQAVCYARVYFDGALMNPGNPTPPFDVGSVAPSTVEAVEYYGGPSETPDKYAGLGAACGVLVLWTRR